MSFDLILKKYATYPSFCAEFAEYEDNYEDVLIFEEISKEAMCNVDSISVNSIVVSGKVKGDIVSQKFVEMKNGSSIQGNVTTSRIRIEDGVDFQGKISMVESAEKTDLFSMNSSEYKDSLTLYQGIDKK